MISISFQGKLFNITVIQVYVPTTDSEDTDADWFCEDLQDLQLTPKKKKKKDVSLIIGYWNAEAGNQEIPIWSNRQV